MNTQTIAKTASKLLKRSGDFLNTNSPTIFAGIAIAGVIGTTAMAVRATLKARDIIDEARYEDPDTGEHVEPEIAEKVVLTWKCYIPVALMAGLTVASIVTSHNIQNKRNVLLAGLYSTSQKALEDYQQKTEEVVGKKKAEQVKEAIIDDQLAKNPVGRNNVIMTGYGNTLCFDTWSGRYFESDINKVKQGVNDFLYQLRLEDRLSMNEFYGYLNVDSAECGESVGWTIDQKLEIEYTSKLASDGRPCLVISYSIPPSGSFRNW